MIYPKISIVTPNFNGARFLEKAICSVLNQNYPNLEYIIIDGGSTDDSLQIINRYKNRISYWISEKDDGMYDAIQKGFDKSSGSIMGWLNADDMLYPNSLFRIAFFFKEYPFIEWIEGINTIFDSEGHTVRIHQPKRRHLIFYLLQLQKTDDFGLIQQESTYWKRTLWEKAGGYLDTKLKYAGDYDLWMRFFLYSNVFLVKKLIGGFRLSGADQLSIKNPSAYLNELCEINHKVSSKLSSNQVKELERTKYIMTILSKVPKFKYFLINLFLNMKYRSKLMH